MELEPERTVTLRALPLHGGARSGCKAVDFTFTEPFSNCINAVRFRNRHSYSISMFCQSSGCRDWKVILWEYALISSPHSLGRSSENWVTLLGDSFLQKVENVTRLRILLKQPSPHWDDFGISNFSLLSSSGEVLAKASNMPRIESGQCLYEIDFLQA